MPGECWGLRGGAGRAGIGVRGSPSHCQPWHCCSPCSHPSPGTSIPTTSISASSIHQPRLQTRGSKPPPPLLPPTPWPAPHCLPKSLCCCAIVLLGIIWVRGHSGPVADAHPCSWGGGGDTAQGRGAKHGSMEGHSPPSAGQLCFSPCPHTHMTCFNFTQICHNFLFSELRMFPLLKQLCWLPVPEWI